MASLEAQVAHIWRRLGFGPTRKDINAGKGMGTAALVDSLFRRPRVDFAAAGFPPASAGEDAHAGRQLELMAFGPTATGSGTLSPAYNPFQERVTWILQGLVVVGIADSVYVADLRDHVKHLRGALGATYRSLLRTVVTRPGMVKYLTADRNTKDHPNQNLGRELLELFSLGRVDPKTGAANYTQQDVIEVSRALSGWRYDWGDGSTWFDPSQWDGGNKTFLGAPRGAAGLDEVMAAIVAHPSWRRHVPARLYKELTGLDATPAVLDALAPSWGADGNLKRLLKAIVKRPEFLSDQCLLNKTKTPVERVVAAARLLGWPGLATDVNLPWLMTRMAQDPWSPPNVSGWPKGDQWLNTTNLHSWSDVANLMALRGFRWDGAATGPVNPMVTKVHTRATPATAAAFVCKQAGLTPVSPRTLDTLHDYATAGSWTPARAAGLLNLVLLSPEFLAN
ncbi:MAG: DUF1800 family protein [Acidimicrobiales bacterium]|nr:DUF1800 family protein [Acidimicrobiales bacterium]MCB9371867.1 DUF1800 family protein [Microthrixaceae bacterium]